MHVDTIILLLQGSNTGQEIYSTYAAVFCNTLLYDFTELYMQARKADEEYGTLRCNVV